VKAVAIKDLKNRLSAYLREVQAGEVVLVTDRGRVVAELRKPGGGTPLTLQERALEQLAADGVLVREAPHDPHVYRTSPLPRAVAAGDLLDAERGER
jgi:antitoxin (DNA-binding transcriptional repressor) of toxin-antitoxin stability system